MNVVAWLTGPTEDGSQGQWELKSTRFIIGRKSPADLILPLPRVSRQHALIQQTEWGYTIVDMGSRNGTFVNGETVGDTPRPLKGGDEIVIGGSVALQFNDPEETAMGPRIGKLHGVWIDPKTNAVWIDAIKVEPEISPAQLTLLKLLYDSADTIISREQIIHVVWPDVDPSGVSGEAVDGLIKRLRKRLRTTQPNHEYIDVIRGHGLRLNSSRD